MTNLFRRIFGKHSENGQSMVELALTLPLVLVLLCGILDFGWIYSNTYKIEYAAGTGARYASLHCSSMGDSELRSAVASEVRHNLGDQLADADITVSKTGEEVSVSVTCPVKTLTFVANVIWGSYYNATGSATAAY